jgi:hypothetical protein
MSKINMKRQKYNMKLPINTKNNMPQNNIIFAITNKALKTTTVRKGLQADRKCRVDGNIAPEFVTPPECRASGWPRDPPSDSSLPGT